MTVDSTFDKLSKRFSEWLKLLRETDELYKTLATLPEVRDKLVDDIVRRINQNFAKRRFDALAEDAEQFQKECNELITQRETWVATKREEFNNRKEGLRDWLKQMGIERADFPARYDHLEHEPSYEEMYSQVSGIARQHIEDLRRQTDEVRLDLRQVRQIQWAKLEPEQRETLKRLDKDYTQLEKQRGTVRQTLDALNLIEASPDSLPLLAQQIAEMLGDVRRIKYDVAEFLRPVEPKTDIEKAVLELLLGQREVNLTDLVLKTEHDLAQIMEGLIGLYQGSQVTIKVTRRG